MCVCVQLNDAYEEVDEQRQVVAQWKRKSQKIQVTLLGIFQNWSLPLLLFLFIVDTPLQCLVSLRSAYLKLSRLTLIP